MRHAENNLVRPFLGGELDGLVQHRDHHVEPFDRELLLAEERAAEVALEALDLREALEQPASLVRHERLAVAARLDRRAQPDALLVVGDVLDLVGTRAAVRLAKPRQHVGQRLTGDVDAKNVGRDQLLELGRQLRLQAFRLEGRVADRLRAERVEPCGEVPMGAVGLDERHRRCDRAQEGLVRRGAAGSAGAGGASAAAAGGAGAGAVATWPLPSSSRSSTSRARPGWVATSSLAPLSNSVRHSLGTASGFSRYCSRSALAKPAFRPSTSCMLTVFVVPPGYPPGAARFRGSEQRMVGDDGRRHPDHEAGAADPDRERRQALVPAAHRRRDQGEQQRCRDQPAGAVGDADQAREDGQGRKQARDRVGRDVREIRGGRSPSSRSPGGPSSGEPCGPGLGLRGGGRHGGLGSRSSASTGNCAGSGGFGSALTAQ